MFITPIIAFFYLFVGVVGIGIVYFVAPTIIATLLRYYFAKRIRMSGIVCLTFDDGPDPKWTPTLLNVLDRWKIRATFFLLADSSLKNPEIVRAILRSGHEIGCHGYEHRHPWTTSPHLYLADLYRCHRSLDNRIGIKSKSLFRPTFGKANLFTLLYALVYHMHIVFWDVDPHDYRCSSSKEIVDHVVSAIRDSNSGATILLHDGRINNRKNDVKITIDAVLGIISALKKEGCNFGTISEALERPKVERYY